MVEVNRLRFEKKGLTTLFSPLEASVLEVLWQPEKGDNASTSSTNGADAGKQVKGMRVREIHEALAAKKKVALTSVAVILDRLYAKGIVARKVEYGKGGPHYLYFPKTSKNELEYSVLDNAVKNLIKVFGPIAVNYFNEKFGDLRKGKNNA